CVWEMDWVLDHSIGLPWLDGWGRVASRENHRQLCSTQHREGSPPDGPRRHAAVDPVDCWRDTAEHHHQRRNGVWHVRRRVHWRLDGTNRNHGRQCGGPLSGNRIQLADSLRVALEVGCLSDATQTHKGPAIDSVFIRLCAQWHDGFLGWD